MYATIGDSIRYLSHHGRGSLSKARDDKTGQALFRTGLYAATQCKQKLIQSYATSLAQRRFAQATSTTTRPR